LGNIHIPDGATVLVCIAAANRDPIVIENGDSLDVHREKFRSLTFGAGVHNCLGQHMARLELNELFGALSFKAKRLKLRGRHPEFRSSVWIRALEEFDVEIY
jgi:cytochrome P450